MADIANLELIKWISAIGTSSIMSAFYTRWQIRRENRIRDFDMAVDDSGNVTSVPADYLGSHYQCVRYVQYRLQNISGKDFGELALSMGFKGGKVVNVLTQSDVFGEKGAKTSIDNDNSITVVIPVFNRKDVLLIKIEIADCQDIDLVWRYVKSHTGIQIKVSYSLGSVIGTPSSSGKGSSLKLKKIGLVRKCRQNLASWIHPK